MAKAGYRSCILFASLAQLGRHGPYRPRCILAAQQGTIAWQTAYAIPSAVPLSGLLLIGLRAACGPMTPRRPAMPGSTRGFLTCRDTEVRTQECLWAHLAIVGPPPPPVLRCAGSSSAFLL